MKAHLKKVQLIVGLIAPVICVPLARRLDTPKTLSSRRAEGTPKIYYGKLNYALDTEIGEMHTLLALTTGY